MGVNGVGGNRFHTYNFNELMNGKPLKQAASKQDKSADGVVFLAMQSSGFARNHVYSTYGKAFIEETKQRQAMKKTQTAGKKDPEYNHKKFTNKMKNAKRSAQMTSVLADIRATIADLKAKQATGQYDEEEIAAAILHAELMEAVAMKRMENLETEEMADRKVKREELEELMEEEKSGEPEDAAATPSRGAPGEAPETTEEEQLDAEMQAMMEEIALLQEEMAAQMQEDMEEMLAQLSEEDPLQALDDMAKILSASASEEDVEEMKKKHRAAEDMAAARADMEFLKFKFHRLQREREALKSGAALSGRNDASRSAQAPGFADGAKIVAGAVGRAHLKTVQASLSSSSAAAPAPDASAAGASIDISG